MSHRSVAIWRSLGHNELTYGNRNKMSDILQTTFSFTFSLQKSFVLPLMVKIIDTKLRHSPTTSLGIFWKGKSICFRWRLFHGVHLTISQCCFRWLTLCYTTDDKTLHPRMTSEECVKKRSYNSASPVCQAGFGNGCMDAPWLPRKLHRAPHQNLRIF